MNKIARRRLSQRIGDRINSAHQSHAKSFIISKLKAKCKAAAEELHALELREAEIDQKQQVLKDLRSAIQQHTDGNLFHFSF